MSIIESIGSGLARSRIGDVLFAEERRRTSDAMTLMLNAYQAGPWVLPPEQLLAQMREVDPWQVWNMLDRRGWEVLGGAGYSDASAERERAVEESKRLYKYNPIGQWTIWLWTSWGMGDKLQVTVRDNDAANEVVEEFFNATRNDVVLADDKIKELSRWLLVKGNRFIAFYINTLDGETTIRTIPQEQMQPVANPGDTKDVWFYKRQWNPSGGTMRTRYYPDWHTYFGGDIERSWSTLVDQGLVEHTAEKAWDNDGEMGARIDTCVMFVAHNIKDEDELWGWPILTCPRAWIQSHERYMESRLTAAEARTMFVRRKKVTGGSRAVNAVRSTIASNLSATRWTDSNPPAVAGAVELDNERITTEDIPLSTSASDTKTDNETFSWLGLLGGGLFPTSAGLDTARWATALEMDKPQSMLFEEYGKFWATQFHRIAEVVLMAREMYSGVSFGEYTIDVSIDTFSLSDFPSIGKALGQFTTDVLTPLTANGVIPQGAVASIAARFVKMALDSLGVEDSGELTSDEAFGIGIEDEEPAPEVPEPDETEEPEIPEEAGLEQVARIIGENLAGGDVTLAQTLEWAIMEAVERTGQ